MTTNGVATLPMIRLLPPTAIDGYMVSARGLIPSLTLLAGLGSEHLRGSALIAGMVVECALKAFLTHAGMTERELSNYPLGHNLETLWIEAVKRHLPLQEAPPQWCVVLNALHGPPHYHLRYQSKAHGLVFPKAIDISTEIPKVFAFVEQALRTP